MFLYTRFNLLLFNCTYLSILKNITKTANINIKGKKINENKIWIHEYRCLFPIASIVVRKLYNENAKCNAKYVKENGKYIIICNSLIKTGKLHLLRLTIYFLFRGDTTQPIPLLQATQQNNSGSSPNFCLYILINISPT